MFDRLTTARALALTNPRLALALLRTSLATTDYTIAQTFYNPTPGVVQNNTATRQITPCDAFVYAVYYTVNRPNSFPGNIFRGQADYYNAKISSGISARLQSLDCDNRVFTDNFQPLETVATIHGEVDDGSHQFFLPWGSGMYAEFQWNRTATSDDNPTVVTIVFRTQPLGCKNFDDLTVPTACEVLSSSYGIAVNPALVLPSQPQAIR